MSKITAWEDHEKLYALIHQLESYLRGVTNVLGDYINFYNAIEADAPRLADFLALLNYSPSLTLQILQDKKTEYAEARAWLLTRGY